MERFVSWAEHIKRRFVPLSRDNAEGGAEQYYAKRYLGHIAEHLSGVGSTQLRILDVGCGTGRFLVPLASLGHHLTGVDHHRDSIRRVLQKVEPFKDRVEIRDGGADAVLPTLPADRFDAALCIEVLYTHRDRFSVMRSIYRAVRPGGLLFITHRPRWFYVCQSLQGKHFDDALLAQRRSGGRLRKGNHRIFNNWQTVDEAKSMHETLGATVLALVPIGPYSGFSTDPHTAICDPGTLTDTELQQLAELETEAGPEMLATSRYILVVSRKPSSP